MDQIGPLTRDVTDCAHLLNVIAGYDEKDSTSTKAEVPDFTKSLVQDEKDSPTVYTVNSVNKIRQMPLRLTVKFQVNRDVFSEAVSFAVKLLPQRTTLPILSGVLLRAEGSTVTLSSVALPIVVDDPQS